jgi:hypothetical protein
MSRRPLIAAAVLLAGLLIGWGARRMVAEPRGDGRGVASGVRPVRMTSRSPAAEDPVGGEIGMALTSGLPLYHERPAGEWQGMPVNVTEQPACETAATCGLAMACNAGRCGPCSSDSACNVGETCVLDHCVRRELASCHARRDCAADEMCVLSGYSPDPRGNGEMKATCLAPRGGTEPPPVEPAAEPPVKLTDDSVMPGDLLESLDPP